MREPEKKSRNENIKIDRKNGMSYAEISRKYGISLERVRQICLKKEYDGELKGLSLRVRHALNRAGVMSKQQLIEYLDEDGRLFVRNIGAKGIAELETLTGMKFEKAAPGFIGIRVVKE